MAKMRTVFVTFVSSRVSRMDLVFELNAAISFIMNVCSKR